MKKGGIKEVLAYVFVSVLAVGLAATLSLQFLKPASSQEESSIEDAAVEEGRPSFPDAESETMNSAREIEVFLEPFIYESGDRRSPFEPYVERSLVDRGVPLGPLQKYGLEELSLMGIMWDVRNPKAMFVDPKSQVHVVGRDEGIGRKNGYIAAIREGEVVVVEAERTDSGIVYQTKVIRLPR